jgi:twitching motility protein PilT
MLREQGYCDVSYGVPGVARFRVNVFIQRGSCAVVMRVIPTAIPDLKSLGAPDEIQTVSTLRDGLVLVTGPRASGKSSTLAALINHINETTACHIITIEDPIEFLHTHKRATVHQRELHSDTPSVLHAMRAAMRQAPNVIVVGELKERETIEFALEAAETGHLVLSTMNTLSAAKAVERLVSSLPANDEAANRARLARILRLVVCQRLIPRQLDGRPVAVFEIVSGDSSLLRLRPCGNSQTSFRCDGPCSLDAKIEKLVRARTISSEVALDHAVDASALSKKLQSTSDPHLR